MYKYFVAFKAGRLIGNGIFNSKMEIKNTDHIMELQDHINKQISTGEKAVIINYILIKD